MEELWDLGTEINDNPLESTIGLSIYSEFVDTLVQLENKLVDDEETFSVFTEDMVGQHTFKTSAGRSADITRSAFKAFDDVTTGAGNLIYYGTKTTLNGAKLAGKIIGFIFNIIAWLPKMINKLMSHLAKLTREKIQKLQGKMGLYITVQSLELFESTIRNRIDRFLRLCKVFSEGDWIVKLFKPNDFRIYNDMKTIYNALKVIRYEITTVDLKSKDARETYFNPKSDYYVRMLKLNEFFSTKKDELKKLKQDLETKIINMENDRSYFALSQKNRKKALDSVNMVNSFINIVGKYFQYVSEDLRVISKQLVTRRSSLTY